MVAHTTSLSNNLLCEVCSGIDFEKFAISAQFCKKPHQGADSAKVADKDLGTLDEIT